MDDLQNDVSGGRRSRAVGQRASELFFMEESGNWTVSSSKTHTGSYRGWYLEHRWIKVGEIEERMMEKRWLEEAMAQGLGIVPTSYHSFPQQQGGNVARRTTMAGHV